MNILFFMKPKNETAYIYTHNTIRQALEKMKHYNYSVLPVIEKSGKYAGTLSREDIRMAVPENGVPGKAAAPFLRVNDIIRGNKTEYVNAYTEIEDLLLMDLNQAFISVADDRGLFIGIVTHAEIIKYGYIKTSRQFESASRHSII